MKPRLLVLGTVLAAGAASTTLLGYLLFAGRRSLTRTGDANLQRWVGPDTARWLYLAIIALLVAAFAVAAVLGTRAGRAWWSGGAAGAAAGLSLGLLTLLTGAVATGPALLTAPALGAFLLALAGPPGAGAWVARTTRRPRDGALAGLWFGLLLALVAGFALVLRDTVFAGRLVTGAWLHDHFGDRLCEHTTGDTLAACEQGDSLGTMASYWLLFPLLGAGLGALGGLLGTTLAPDPARAPGPAGSGPVARGARLAELAPVGLGAVLLTVFVLEATLKIW